MLEAIISAKSTTTAYCCFITIQIIRGQRYNIFTSNHRFSLTFYKLLAENVRANPTRILKEHETKGVIELRQ